MSTIFSYVFEKLTDPLSLPLPWLAEWILMLIVSEAAYHVSFKKVGCLYRDGWIEKKNSGSFLHWTIRFVIFFAMWACLCGVIWLGNFVLAHFAAVLFVVLVIAYAYFSLYRLLNFYLKTGGRANA